jgi:hypothetical protein
MDRTHEIMTASVVVVAVVVYLERGGGGDVSGGGAKDTGKLMDNQKQNGTRGEVLCFRVQSLRVRVDRKVWLGD